MVHKLVVPFSAQFPIRQFEVPSPHAPGLSRFAAAPESLSRNDADGFPLTLTLCRTRQRRLADSAPPSDGVVAWRPLRGGTS